MLQFARPGDAGGLATGVVAMEREVGTEHEGRELVAERVGDGPRKCR